MKQVQCPFCKMRFDDNTLSDKDLNTCPQCHAEECNLAKAEACLVGQTLYVYEWRGKWRKIVKMLKPFLSVHDEGLAFVTFAKEQKEWSETTFGTKERRGPIGPLKHLEKEAKEAYEEKDVIKQQEEIADCLFLVLDAAWRAGMSISHLTIAAFKKLEKNKNRVWPKPDTTNPDQPVEHNRSSDGQ